MGTTTEELKKLYSKLGGKDSNIPKASTPGEVLNGINELDLHGGFSGDYNDLTNKPPLGTASPKDVAASGDASSSQVVMGNDSRLTNRRGSTWGQINGTLANQTDLKGELDDIDNRIDSIIALPDGSTTADAELVDIRNGVHGQTFNSAGDAVRASAEQLYNMKTGFDGVVYSSPAAMVQGEDQFLSNMIDAERDDPIQGVVVTNDAESVRFYTNGAFQWGTPLNLTSRLPVASITSGFSGSTAIFYKLKNPISINSNNYNRFSMYIKVKEGYTGSPMELYLGTMSDYTWQTSFGAINWTVENVKESGFIYKTDALVNTAGKTTLRFVFIRGNASDLANIDYITYYDSPFAEEFNLTDLESDIDSIESDINLINGNPLIGLLPENSDYNCRYYNNSAFTWSPISVTSKIPVKSVINSLSGMAYIWYKLKSPIPYNANLYNPFSAYIKVQDGNTSSLEFTFGLASNMSFNTQYATLNVIGATLSKSGFVAKTEPFTNTVPSTTKFEYIFISASADTLKKIEWFSFYNSEWADPIANPEIPTYSNDYSFIAYGDSLTQGAGGGGTTYSSVIHSAFPNSTYYNEGVGGDSPAAVAYRANAGELIIPANTDPTSAFEPVAYFGGKPYGIPPYDTSKTFDVWVEGVKYTAQNASATTITISGCPTKTYPRSMRFLTKRTADVTIIWMGTNSTRIFADVEGYIDSVISEAATNYYLVLGLTVDEDNGKIATYNAAAKAKYREHFVDIKDFLVNYGLTVMGITPTADDTARIAAGNVPSSLLSDNVHFTADGYTAIGKCLIDRIYGLGYDRFLS